MSPAQGGSGVSPQGEPTAIGVTTLYGARNREPLVMLRLGDLKPLHLRTAEARRVAHLLLEAAESAEQDGFLVEHFRDVFGLEESQVASLLHAFRDHREKWSAEKERI